MPEQFYLDELRRISGVDIPIEGLGITVKQPKIFEIAMLGETNYFIALRLFTLTKESLKIETKQTTNWDIFLKSIDQKIEGITNTRNLVSNFLQLFFNETIILGPRSIMIQSIDGIKNIEPEDFNYFQSIIGAAGGKQLLGSGEETFKPKNKRAAEIAEKMKKARAKIAKVKADVMGIDPSKNNGFLNRYIRVVATKTANSIEQINHMTPLQVNDLMQTYLAWEEYDLSIKARLAGSKDDKELVHWTSKNIYGDNNDDNIGRI